MINENVKSKNIITSSILLYWKIVARHFDREKNGNHIAMHCVFQ